MVSAIEAFRSTWTQAHDGFGHGAPVEGARFDQSAELHRLRETVESATPGSTWTGSGSEGYASANAKQANVIGGLADLDGRLAGEIDRAAAVVGAGRRDLHTIRNWVDAASAHVPPTLAGEWTRWRIVAKGSGDVADVIERSHSDLSATAQRVRSLGDEYDSLGTPEEDGGVQLVDWPHEGDRTIDAPRNALDLRDIVYKKPFDPNDPSTLGDRGYMELVPRSGVWVPDPNSPGYRPGPVEAPLDARDIVYYPPQSGGTKPPGLSGYMELVPGSGAWVPDPNSPSYVPHTPEVPIDLSEIKTVHPKSLVPWEYMELWPHAGVLIPNPYFGQPS